jgi:hypothetical protein
MSPANIVPKVSVKHAVQLAEQFVRDLYASGDIKGLRLEEVEMTEDEKGWLVTLSFLDPPSNNISAFIQGNESRQYKIVKIDARTGKCLSMKIRTRG